MNRLFPDPQALRNRRLFSRWDLVVLPLVLGGLYLATVAFRGVDIPYGPGSPNLTVHLAIANLPYYALQSSFRMLVAIVASLLFTLIYAPIAAKSKRAERILIPVLDFLQSLPIFGFLTATTLIFIGIFHGLALGLEAASIFAVFTSQVWNMTFSFYNSLLTVPRELDEAARILGLSAWQRFWRLELPYAMPALIWNTMMSVSGGWFFIVASEALSVVGRNRLQYLPGVGSYVSLAIQRGDISAMVAAGAALFLVVLLYDQLIFRPMVAWADKFKFEESAGERSGSWVLTALQRSQLIARAVALLAVPWSWLFAASRRRPIKPVERPAAQDSRWRDLLWGTALALLAAALALAVLRFLFGPSLGLGPHGALAPNPNLNPSFRARLATSYRVAGVQVGPSRAVWASRVCHRLAQPGAGQLRRLLGARMSSLACGAQMVPAGRVAWESVPKVLVLGFYTMLRVLGALTVAGLIWTPIGVWVGFRPRLARAVQPLVQFAAAFPANLLFPLVVVWIANFHLNPQVFVAPLMILGSQWYILFNVIAAASAIPSNLREAAKIYHLRGALLWRRLILPGIFSGFVTGGITAGGAAWNASVVAEVVSWGSITLTASGVGAYIAHWSIGELNPHVLLGMVVMAIFVLLFNRLLWRRLFRFAEERFRFD